MGFVETSLMRQLGKLVEVVRHAYEILSDGYRLSVVSADYLAVQGGLTNVLSQFAVGFSRPQPQCLVAWLRELYRDRLRQLANPACRRSSALSPVPACLSFDILFTVGTLTFCDRREQNSSALMVERGVLGFPKHNLAPSQNTLVGTTAFQLSTSKVADLNSHNLRQASKSSS